MTLNDAKINQEVRILAILGEKSIRRRLMDMGLTKKQVIMIKKVAPLGDPIEIRVRGYDLSLRKADAKNIEVEPVL